MYFITVRKGKSSSSLRNTSWWGWNLQRRCWEKGPTFIRGSAGLSDEYKISLTPVVGILFIRKRDKESWYNSIYEKLTGKYIMDNDRWIRACAYIIMPEWAEKKKFIQNIYPGNSRKVCLNLEWIPKRLS
jgi:hypothetical protein